MTASAPRPPARRLEVLDALRGVALLGVLLANLRDFSLYAFLPEAARAALPTAAWDRPIELAMAALVDAKAATLFAMLFGVGFALHTASTRHYLRRLLVLLAIGLVHALLWWGDILRYYALLGLLLLPAARLGARGLAVAGLLTALLAWPLLQPVMRALLPALAPADAAAAAALQAFSGADGTAALRGNLDYDLRLRIANWSLLGFVLGRLLIGAAMGRAGLFEEPQARAWQRLLRIGLPVGAALTAFALLRDHGLAFADGWWRTEPGRQLARVLRSGASLALALGYAALFVRLFQRPRWHRVLRAFAPVGRMALTHYLTHTLVALPLFYGFGAGIGPRFGLAGVLGFGTLLFAVQMGFSRWWLRRFRFGPAEWLWRSLAEGTRLPMRR